MTTKTDWEQTLEKHDKLRCRQDQAAVDTAKRDAAEQPDRGGEVAAAVRYVGHVLLAGLILSVLAAIAMISMASSA